MLRSLGLTVALTVSASAILMPAEAGLADRSLPMRFELRLPAESCGAPCRFLISARGSITADSASEFRDFAKATGRDLRHAVVVLDSDGGSVHGAIDLGREIRQFELDATVGKLIDVASAGETRARLSPRADCESMCAFVLLGGVHRMVPRESRVMVHQIWLGDRREDPAASNYSAEDLVLVQRDIGKLAVYAAEMGASAGLLDLSLRVPPWEPMHVMSAAELRDTGLVTAEPEGPPALMASLLPVAAPVLPGPANGSRVDAIGERRWSLMQRAGVAVLSRRHPLTADGETIGSFDLNVSCGKSSGVYDVLYVDRRFCRRWTPFHADCDPNRFDRYRDPAWQYRRPGRFAGIGQSLRRGRHRP
jgi:hypothetical protein